MSLPIHVSFVTMSLLPACSQHVFLDYVLHYFQFHGSCMEHSLTLGVRRDAVHGGLVHIVSVQYRDVCFSTMTYLKEPGTVAVYSVHCCTCRGTGLRYRWYIIAYRGRFALN